MYQQRRENQIHFQLALYPHISTAKVNSFGLPDIVLSARKKTIVRFLTLPAIFGQTVGGGKRQQFNLQSVSITNKDTKWHLNWLGENWVK